MNNKIMHAMLRCLFFIMITLFGSVIYAQQNLFTGIGTFYIVRHAEKDTGLDPMLSTAGRERAGNLYRTLQFKQVKTIYCTKYRRSGMTADSLRIYQQIDTILYTPDTTGNGLLRQLNNHFGKEMSVLIIGHSNTVPAIIRALGVNDLMLSELPETSYDDLFIVQRKKRKIKFRHLHYGVKTVGK